MKKVLHDYYLNVATYLKKSVEEVDAFVESHGGGMHPVLGDEYAPSCGEADALMTATRMVT